MKHSGFSLIESLIGTALMLLVFVSIFGVFNMGIKIVGKSKAKAGAIALTTERMELIRNLPYSEVGTLGGLVPGDIPQTESIVLNGIDYTRSVFVQYVDDPKDGLGADDENGITADYKVARVEVNWAGAANPVVFVSNIIPKGIETLAGGGTLKLNVFDASALPVASAQAHIENPNTDPPVSTDVFTNSQGKLIFPGVATSSGYEITITKDGYSSAQTYGADSYNVNPNPAHLTILEGKTTEASFVIDKVSVKTVRTWKPVSGFTWYDSFDDWNKVSTSSNISISAGRATLAEEATSSYFAAGFLMSSDMGGISNLVNWGEFSWNDNEPASTTVKYQIYYYDILSNLVPVPDSDLPGNESGFENSPVDLTSLSTSTYPTLRLEANLSTADASSTPALLDWRFTWNAGPDPLPDIPFHMQGEKTIGSDAGGDPIYKYSKDLSTGAGGQLEINNLEFDVYGITIDSVSTGYDISESCPFQPVNILPDTTNTIDLYLVPHADNTFLTEVEAGSGGMLEGASVRLYNAGYDETRTTSACGQTFFTPLSSGAYSMEVSKNGYETATSTLDISGQKTLKIILNEL